MNVYDAIMTRRTIRQFLDRPVEEEKVETLLRAAMQAPSAAKQNAWEFLLTTDPQRLARLAETDEYSAPAESAPLVITAMWRDDSLIEPLYWPQELAAATQNMLVEAVELGLGAVWMGVAPKLERMHYVHKVLELPSTMHVFAMVAVGYPLHGVEPHDNFDPAKVHYEVFGNNHL